MAALIIAIFPQNSSRGNWEEQQDRTDPNSQFELARKPAWLLAFRQFGLPKWKHDFECSSLQPLRYASVYKYSLLGTNHIISSNFETVPLRRHIEAVHGSYYALNPLKNQDFLSICYKKNRGGRRFRIFRKMRAKMDKG